MGSLVKADRGGLFKSPPSPTRTLPSTSLNLTYHPPRPTLSHPSHLQPSPLPSSITTKRRLVQASRLYHLAAREPEPSPPVCCEAILRRGAQFSHSTPTNQFDHSILIITRHQQLQACTVPYPTSFSFLHHGWADQKGPCCSAAKEELTTIQQAVFLWRDIYIEQASLIGSTH